MYHLWDQLHTYAIFLCFKRKVGGVRLRVDSPTLPDSGEFLNTSGLWEHHMGAEMMSRVPRVCDPTRNHPEGSMYNPESLTNGTPMMVSKFGSSPFPLKG